MSAPRRTLASVPASTPAAPAELPAVLSAIGVIAQALAPIIAQAIRDELRAGREPDWLNQHQSALGPRRHCAAVRRRIREGSGGAEVSGRNCLLSRTAHDEELARPRKRRAAPEADARALAEKLGIRLVPGRGAGNIP